jgi:hypothetical protein
MDKTLEDPQLIMELTLLLRVILLKDQKFKLNPTNSLLID